MPATPRRPAGAKSIFVIIRGRSGPGDDFTTAVRGLAPFPYADIFGYVGRAAGGGANGRGIHDHAIFHGFRSQAEAVEYWNAATADAPLQWLPPRSLI